MNNFSNKKVGADAYFNALQIDMDNASIVSSSVTSWSMPQTRLLIRELQKYPCLYNVEDPNYTNQKKRKEKYNLMMAKLKKCKSDVTIQSIKRKIRTLQSQIFKERQYSKKFDIDTGEVYKPKLWCYTELSFLFNSTAPPEPNSSSIEPSEGPEIENNDGSTPNEHGWKREQTLLFLKELEKYPCLYNPTDNYFANKRKRNEKLNIMLPEIKKFKSDVTIECIKKKIRSLQVQLCREARTLKQSDADADEVYEPKLWCYNELSFMVQCRDFLLSCSNLELSEASEIEDDKDDYSIMEQMMLNESGWTREQTLSLIRELQKYPCLYNPADSLFSNKTTRNSRLTLMLAKIRKCKPDATYHTIKRKIRTLQSQLWKERKRSQKFKAVAKEEYTPKLWCYNELLFLVDCKDLQPSSSRIEPFEKSTDIPSIQLNNQAFSAIKIEEQFMEQDLEEQKTLPRPNLSYDKLEVESLSNEYYEEENFPIANSEEDNENSDIQNLSNEDDFCQYLCSQFKKIHLDENLEEVKLEILQLVSKKIIEEKRMQNQKKYSASRSVQKRGIDPLEQTASPHSYSTLSLKLPVSKVIDDESSKTIFETGRNRKWSSTSSSSTYSTTQYSTTPNTISEDKIGNNLPKRTFMQISDKRFIKEATTKRKILSSLPTSSSSNLTSNDPLALAVENVFVEEYIDYE